MVFAAVSIFYHTGYGRADTVGGGTSSRRTPTTFPPSLRHRKAELEQLAMNARRTSAGSMPAERPPSQVPRFPTPIPTQAGAQRLAKVGMPIEEYPQTVSNLTAATSKLFDLIQSRSIALYLTLRCGWAPGQPWSLPPPSRHRGRRGCPPDAPRTGGSGDGQRNLLGLTGSTQPDRDGLADAARTRKLNYFNKVWRRPCPPGAGPMIWRRSLVMHFRDRKTVNSAGHFCHSVLLVRHYKLEPGRRAQCCRFVAFRFDLLHGERSPPVRGGRPLILHCLVG